MDKKMNVFLILGGKNPLSRVPLQTFLCKNYTDAKLYFEGYIIEERHKEDFVLYKIGEIDRQMNFEKNKVFICGGYETQFKKTIREKIEQLKFDKELENKAEKIKEQKEQIKTLFDGVYL